MKNTFYIILCGLSLLMFAACKKSSETGSQSHMRGVLYASVSADASALKLLPGKSKTIEVKVRAVEGKVSDATLKLSLKADPDGVAAYNRAYPDDPAELLPASAYSFTSNNLMLARYNTASTSAKIRIAASGLEDNQLYVLPISIDKVEGTDNWEQAEQPYAYITLIQVDEGPEGGDGSMEYPYILSTAADMKAMADKLSADEKVYFRMANDIDMAGIDDWTPLNYSSPYDFQIDFDGAGYTIDNFHVTDFASYPSFFGVLNGYCHDVTFTNALIICSADSGCGILGGYGGTGDKHADVARVHLHGQVLFHGNKTGVGGMFGCAGNATIEACSAEVEVWSGKNYVGGLVGYSKKVEISNCWTGGFVRGDQRVGGIIGGINGDGDSIINSYSIAKIEGRKWDGESGDYTDETEQGCLRSVGGIVAHAAQDKNTDIETRMPGNVVQGCIAWQESIRTRSYVADVDFSKDNYYSSGAIVAFGATHNTYADCYRRADMDFRDYNDLFILYDQDNSSPTSPLAVTKIEGATYYYPYHGKAAPAGATLTQVAQTLGWSTAIWDFSTDIPTIRPDAQVGPVPDVSGDGSLPGFDENDLN